MKKDRKIVLGIDPGKTGSFVLFDGVSFRTYPMPTRKEGKDEFVDFDGVHSLLWDLVEEYGGFKCYLERAVSWGMGVKGAFNYGRGFAAIENAVHCLQLSVVYVEPGKWAKVMHQGISSELKPKAKSLIAVRRLFPKLVKALPRNKKGRMLDGPVDALLIAAYGFGLRGDNFM